MINPNSEVGNAHRAAARGAHAAGVPFSAARRKLRTTHFFVWGGKLELGHEGLGGPPKPARGPRALPSPISEFGFNAQQPGGGGWVRREAGTGGRRDWRLREARNGERRLVARRRDEAPPASFNQD